MKRLFFVCILCSVLCVPIKAVDYCASSSWGYADNVTGGGSATPTLVTNETELASALNTKNSVIIITQDITVTNHISTDKSNITIMALPGKKLISNMQNKDNSGILYLKGNNLLLRNLTLIGPGAYDCNGWDLLCLDKATNVWVDHCDFQDGCDGNFDIKSTADNITVTWCRFRYLKAPRAGGKETDDHRFSNLVGSSGTDMPADSTYNITYGFCWWDEGCKQRMTRCRNALIHYLNCYWNSSVADYYVGPENASGYFEGCTFAGNANSPTKIWNPYKNTTNYCTFVNCTGNLPTNSSIPVAAPSYAYDQLAPSTALSYVTNASCGAGATLTVTTTAEVSSACAGGDEPEPVVSAWWNISDDDFKYLDTLSSETVVRDLHIVATESKTVTIDAKNASYGSLNFTHRLKLGGTGNANYRHLWFDVAGDCTITVYLTSASTTDTNTRTLNIASGSFSNTVSTMSAPSASVNKQTYTYSGDATKIYLYSANSGINIYGIQVASSTTEIPPVVSFDATPSDARKILHNGQLLILHNQQIYTPLGHRIE